VVILQQEANIEEQEQTDYLHKVNMTHSDRMEIK
jgi:hypothetical protein